jgi:alpha-tubulin suppressor-like RCC1 family protein
MTMTNKRIIRAVQATGLALGTSAIFTATVSAQDLLEPKIANGSDFSVAITTDGEVIAWGSNGFGQCDVPDGIVNPVRVAAWEHHALALQADGTVVAWGANQYGQSTVPADLPPLMDVNGLSRGSIALTLDGSPIGWGQNYSCGSGSGTLDMPAELSGVTGFYGGNAHWLYRAANGVVAGVGCNYNGQLNIPESAQYALDYEANESWSCLLAPSGEIVAIGWGGYGQLQVPGGNDFTDIACGHYFGLGLTSSGEIKHWGRAAEGQAEVPGSLASTGVLRIEAGGTFATAIHDDGSLTMWGSNSAGQCDWPTDKRIRLGDSDCNLNLIPDWLDILRGDLLDGDGDGVPDECDQGSCDTALQVPGDYSTIQAAIDVAEFGCTIEIAPGTYGAINLQGKAITLRGTGAPGDVVIDAQSNGRAVEAAGITSGTLLIEGITIRNGRVTSTGTAGGGGLDVSGSSVTLTEVEIINCSAFREGSGYYDAQGGALMCSNAQLTLSGCTINDNIAESRNYGNSYATGRASGGAIYAVNSTLMLIDCTFARNTANSVSSGSSWHNVECEGGVLVGIDSDVVIENCTMLENEAIVTSQSSSVAAVIANGGALKFRSGSVVIQGGQFINNEVRSTSSATYYQNPTVGGCLHAEAGVQLEIADARFKGNLVAGGLNAYAYVGGGAINLGSGGDVSRSIQRCIFIDNRSGVAETNGDTVGGAVNISSGSATWDSMLMIEGCSFSDNRAESGSALSFEAFGTEIMDSHVCGGEDPQLAGEWIDLGNVVFATECSDCPYDLNSDGMVGGGDMSILLGWWGTSGGTQYSPDFTGDGLVDGEDLTLLLAAWGKNCP